MFIEIHIIFSGTEVLNLFLVRDSLQSVNDQKFKKKSHHVNLVWLYTKKKEYNIHYSA